MLNLNSFKLVLASSSPRRKALLGDLGLSFIQIFPQIDEVPLHDKEPPADYVVRLAGEKGDEAARQLRLKGEDYTYLIVSADTVVVIDQQVLEKPNSKSHARSMLEKLSSRRHTVITGMCLLKTSGRGELLHEKRGFFETHVYLRALSSRDIEWYIETGESMDKAGSYAIQGIGSSLVSSIEGSYTNVVGLPLAELQGWLSDISCQ